jgi:hypothetical protein
MGYMDSKVERQNNENRGYRKLRVCKKQPTTSFYGNNQPPASSWGQRVIELFIALVLLCNISQTQPNLYEIYIVAQPITNDKLLPSSVPDQASIGSEVELFACPGEYEPASFAIRAEGDLHAVKLESSELVSSEGVISKDNVDLRVVKCWYQAGVQVWDVKHKLLTPELLLKDDTFVTVDTEKGINILKSPEAPKDAEELMPVEIEKETLKQFWITVSVPENTPPGDYKGVIKISPENAPQKEVTVKLKVLPIKLSEPFLDYAIYYRGKLRLKGKIEVGSEWKTPQQFEAEMRDLKAHGISNPTVYQPIDYELLEKVIEIRKKAGIVGVPLLSLGLGTGAPTNKEGLDALKHRTRQLVEFAKKHGIPEVYVYGIDEATGERLKTQRQAWQAVHEAGGKVFVACSKGFFDAIGDLLDLPIMAGATAWHVEEVHKLGRKMYNYANPQVGNEEPETYRRNYGLRLWKAGYDGVCDYAYQHAFGNIYDDFDHKTHRDHIFAYPTVDGVIPTVQWEGFREGVDDVRYLTTILQSIDAAKNSDEQSKQQMAKEAEEWLANLDISGDLHQIRWQMAQWILKLL